MGRIFSEREERNNYFGEAKALFVVGKRFRPGEVRYLQKC
jgi:hypothetical protein